MTNPASPQAVPTPRSSYACEPCHLPSSLSTLLEAAIADARALSPDFYYPHSAKWHSTDYSGNCFVCLAGSLIARTLNNQSDLTLNPVHFSLEAARKLNAVDAMRQGIWFLAYQLVYGKTSSTQVCALLSKLPSPARQDYQGWDQMETHIESLEELLPQLREIDYLTASM